MRGRAGQLRIKSQRFVRGRDGLILRQAQDENGRAKATPKSLGETAVLMVSSHGELDEPRTMSLHPELDEPRTNGLDPGSLPKRASGTAARGRQRSAAERVRPLLIVLLLLFAVIIGLGFVIAANLRFEQIDQSGDHIFPKIE